MKLADFDFDLPEQRIALRPASPRSSARMLAFERGILQDLHMADLASRLRPGDLLVRNDTKVLPARLFGIRHRPSAHGSGAARIELTLTEPRADGTWAGLAKPLRKWAEGETVVFSERLSAELLGRADGQAVVRFNCTGADFDAALQEAGAMPLPPYIAAKRPADARDSEDYQTIWAARPGAVAAPTASLHFDVALMAALRARGVKFTDVTLHVGAGTFLPVKTDDIAAHKMHSEWGEVSAEAAAAIAATRSAGGRVIPVGTTALRLIETAARGGTIAPFRGPTDIFITPGFRFYASDGLITNFHLPKSTLLMLVAALIGLDETRRIYAHAIEEEYRFFSYGDGSLLIP